MVKDKKLIMKKCCLVNMVINEGKVKSLGKVGWWCWGGR